MSSGWSIITLQRVVRQVPSLTGELAKEPLLRRVSGKHYKLPSVMCAQSSSCIKPTIDCATLSGILKR